MIDLSGTQELPSQEMIDASNTNTQRSSIDLSAETGEDYNLTHDDDNLLPPGKEFSPIRPLEKSPEKSLEKSQPEGLYLETKDFNYSMTLIDNKINALYKLCRHISKIQHENSKLIKKLVAADELSDGFWNVSFNNNYRIFVKLRNN